jgi:hypothetical protein
MKTSDPALLPHRTGGFRPARRYFGLSVVPEVLFTPASDEAPISVELPEPVVLPEPMDPDEELPAPVVLPDPIEPDEELPDPTAPDEELPVPALLSLEPLPELTPVFGVVLEGEPVVGVVLEDDPVVAELSVEAPVVAELSVDVPVVAAPDVPVVEPLTLPCAPLRVSSLVPGVAVLPVVALPVPVPEPAVPADWPDPLVPVLPLPVCATAPAAVSAAAARIVVAHFPMFINNLLWCDGEHAQGSCEPGEMHGHETPISPALARTARASAPARPAAARPRTASTDRARAAARGPPRRPGPCAGRGQPGLQTGSSPPRPS